MLKFMRRNASATWIQGLFLAIVAVFMLWGVGVGVRGDKTQVAAEVNGATIGVNDFERAYRNLERAYQEIYKDRFDANLMQALNLRGRAMDQLIQVKLLAQAAENLGLEVTDTELRNEIATTPGFQRDGVFNRDVYVRVLASNKLSPSQYELSEREQLLVRKMQDLITGGIHVTDAEVHDRYNFDNEKVSLRYVALTGDMFLDQVQVDDAAVAAHYNDHKDDFREPERVKIDYAQYTGAKFADGVQIAAPDVEAYYQGHQDEFTKQEEVHARHILFRSSPSASAEDKAKVKAKADGVLAKAKAGEDFAKLAQESSEDTSNAPQGGDLGFFPRGRMVPEFEQAAFALEPGKVSDLVQTNFGWHIIKVDEKHPGGVEPLDQVRTKIEATLRNERARNLAQAKANDAQGKVSGGATLAAATAADGVEIKTSPAVGTGESIPGFDHSDLLIDAALKTEVNKVGSVLDAGSSFVVFTVTEKIPSTVPALDAIKDKVSSAARKLKAADLAKAKAAVLLEQLKASKDLDALATANSLKVEETDGMPRAGAYIPGLGGNADLKKDAFALTKEAPVGKQVYDVTGRQVLVVLKDRIAPDAADFDKKKEGLLTQLEGRRRTEALTAYVEDLKKKARIHMGPAFETQTAAG